MDYPLSYWPSGDYYLYTDPNGNEVYHTFTPAFLSDNLEIKIDADMTSLLSTANRLLGQLEGMCAYLPNAAAIESIFLYREALLSCKIDGVTAPFYNLVDASRKQDKTTRPIINYVSALKHGLDKSEAFGYKNETLCEIHGVLMEACGNNESGCFRTKMTSIGKIIVTSNLPMYNPTAPDKLHFALYDLEKFIRRKDNFDVIIKTALAHYQFETIHPFMTGNGRVGRILPYVIMAHGKILTRPTTCLSYYLSSNKVEYFDRMEQLRFQQDYEQWIKFYIKSIIFAAEDSLSKIRCWLQIRDKHLLEIERSNSSIKALTEVYAIIEQHPILDVNVVAEKAGVSYNTAASALKALTKLHIVKQSNNMKRYRDYAYTEFLDCFLGKDMLWELSAV